MQVLNGIEYGRDARVLLGPEGMDDAGVYQWSENDALVQTLDFFPPIVDDPFLYGKIAAANSLSDVYAMGGVPLTVMQIVGFPKDEVPLSVLRDILRGGAETIAESGAAMVGGHSVVDQEIKYGLSVTGRVDPAQVKANAGAVAGDVLYLTKPLGMGAITTAHKKEKVGAELVERAAKVMATLNRDAAEAMVEAGASAATDVTGFGLMGHGAEMARGSGVTLVLDHRAVPFMDEAVELSRKNLLSGGSARTRAFLDSQVGFESSVEDAVQNLMFDAETSGGLLISIAEAQAARLEELLHEKSVPVHRIGHAVPKEEVWIRVT